MKKKLLLLFLFILSIIFLGLTILVLTDNITAFDDIIYDTLISLRSKPLDFYFKSITKFANTIPILCLVIVLLLILDKKERYLLGTSALSSVLVNTIIKYLVARPRPDHLRLIKQGGYSFPSGHSMISICVYGLLIYLIQTKVTNKKLKIVSTILLSILIISIGLSRIYVGVHYPSDVLAGYSLAGILLIIIINLFNKYFRGNSNEKNCCK